MISLEDCIAMCGLDEEEIEAIAEHEHIPAVAAAALAGYLLHQQGGAHLVRDMIVDDTRKALRESRLKHATELLMALRHFMNDHPECARVAAA